MAAVPICRGFILLLSILMLTSTARLNATPLMETLAQEQNKTDIDPSEVVIVTELPENLCGSKEFECSTGRCIPDVWRCDGDPDCKDSEDEDHDMCLKYRHTCSSEEFQCNSGSPCIPRPWKCDGDEDCSDGSDEKNCTIPSCNSGQISCSDRSCIQMTQLCDGAIDCNDGMDETNCGPISGVRICAKGQVSCPKELICLEMTQICDGTIDCNDGMDETNCGPISGVRTCAKGQVSCPEELICLETEKICDGNQDCVSGWDESPAKCPSCRDSEFMCKDRSCIKADLRCNGQEECADGSDELQCNITACSSSFVFDCGEGFCISNTSVCDGENDCPNAEDEIRCGIDECKLDNGGCDQLCVDVDAGYHCNCREGYHLVNKTRCLVKDRHTCTSEEFQCDSGSPCIPSPWKCDGDEDCSDGSDERNCTIPSCNSGQVSCSDRSCIQLTQLCDGAIDCNDGMDETNCGPISGVRTCAKGQVSCPKELICLEMTQICDGTIDCNDGMDETNCGPISGVRTCAKGQVSCPKELICLETEKICDGNQDCPSGWDESPAKCPSCRDSEFMCKDRSCIKADLRCNGQEECADGSDELQCNVTACSSSFVFDCGEGFCISNTSVCDGENDCPNAEDEIRCGIDECKLDNGGCDQLCVDVDAGYHCNCREGYHLVNNTRCLDIDECDKPGICSQRCINQDGSYECLCVNGYDKDPQDGSKCKAIEGHASLLVASSSGIRKISMDNQEGTLIINSTRGAIALDFVFKTGMIFWTDVMDKSIFKTLMDEEEKIMVNNVTNSDGLAVDWLYNHIYWTNADRKVLEVADFDDKMRKTLFKDGIDSPRAIALYPLEGWMFWTDWGSVPKIERAGMDGTHRQTIVTKDIIWPNGITIDQVMHKIYWCDSRMNAIFTANFDGTERRTVLQSDEKVSHPFSISVFEENIYWSDWKQDAILSANKFTGENITVLARLRNPMAVRVYHSYRQPNGSNYCTPSNGLCTHLCLPAPQMSLQSPKMTCACPDGMELMEDSTAWVRPCIDIGSPVPSNYSLESVDASVNDSI